MASSIAPKPPAAPPPSPRATDFRRIGYTLAVLLLLLLGWEMVARQFSVVAKGLLQEGRVFTDSTRNEDLNACLDRLPAPAAPRVLILGSSQIATAKEGRQQEALPTQLQRQLEATGGPAEVLDLSAGGQQVVESLLILLGSLERVRPSAVVLGLGLFSMQSASVRPAVPKAFDHTFMEASLADCSPADLAPRTRELLTGTLKSAPQPGTDKTIQERVDDRISTFLAANFAAYRNRKPMFNTLIDAPVRKDLVAFVNRHFLGMKVARTYDIASAYEPSVAALEIMACRCRQAGVPFYAVLLPYDASISPVPYPPASAQRLRRELETAATRQGFTVLDLGSLLGHDHFGTFVDGSPDGLHYRASGHALVAQRIAAALATGPWRRRTN